MISGAIDEIHHFSCNYKIKVHVLPNEMFNFYINAFFLTKIPLKFANKLSNSPDGHEPHSLHKPVHIKKTKRSIQPYQNLWAMTQLPEN